MINNGFYSSLQLLVEIITQSTREKKLYSYSVKFSCFKCLDLDPFKVDTRKKKARNPFPENRPGRQIFVCHVSFIIEINMSGKETGWTGV